jgi:hypothetical protein
MLPSLGLPLDSVPLFLTQSTTFVAGPPGADQVIAAVEDVAVQLHPGWWRISRSTAW